MSLHPQHESHRQLLGQCRRGKFLRHPDEGAAHRRLFVMRRTEWRGVRVHRDLVQSPTPTLNTRLSHPLRYEATLAQPVSPGVHKTGGSSHWSCSQYAAEYSLPYAPVPFHARVAMAIPIQSGTKDAAPINTQIIIGPGGPPTSGAYAPSLALTTTPASQRHPPNTTDGLAARARTYSVLAQSGRAAKLHTANRIGMCRANAITPLLAW